MLYIQPVTKAVSRQDRKVIMFFRAIRNKMLFFISPTSSFFLCSQVPGVAQVPEYNIFARKRPQEMERERG